MRSGAGREVEGFAGLGDQPLGKEIGGWWKGSPPIPAEGHGTRDRRVAKRDDRHTGARDRERHRHERRAEAGLDEPLHDREIVAFVRDVCGEALRGECRVDDPSGARCASGGGSAARRRHPRACTELRPTRRWLTGTTTATRSRKSGWISRSTTPVGGGPEDAEVVVAAEDTAHHLCGGALLEGESHRRVALEEARQPLGEPAGADRMQEGDADASALRRDGALGFGDGVAEVVEDALGAARRAAARPGSSGYSCRSARRAGRRPPARGGRSSGRRLIDPLAALQPPCRGAQPWQPRQKCVEGRH